MLLPSTFLVILLELTSRILVSQNILIDIYKDSYGKSSLDYKWRTKRRNGAWRKPNYSDRASKECFEVNYQSNSQGARDDEFIISKRDIGLIGVVLRKVLELIKNLL